MSLILDSHPKVCSVDEDRFFAPEIYRYLYSNLPEATPFIAFKLPQYAHMLFFIEALPGRRVLWCIRDPLDVVWSMVKLRWPIGDIMVPWAAHPRGGWFEITTTYWSLNEEQRGKLNEHMTKFARISEKLVTLARSPEKEKLTKIDRQDCVFIAALCWRIKNELPWRYRASNIDFYVIRYEDLVTNPRDRIAEILDYISVDWSEEVLNHQHLHKGISIGNTSNTRAIDQKSLQNGKRNLSQEEQELVKVICGDTALKWNYILN